MKFDHMIEISNKFTSRISKLSADKYTIFGKTWTKLWTPDKPNWSLRYSFPFFLKTNRNLFFFFYERTSRLGAHEDPRLPPVTDHLTQLIMMQSLSGSHPGFLLNHNLLLSITKTFLVAHFEVWSRDSRVYAAPRFGHRCKDKIHVFALNPWPTKSIAFPFHYVKDAME